MILNRLKKIEKRLTTYLLNSHIVTLFEFGVSLIGIHRLLHSLTGTTNFLQDRVVDIINSL